MAQQSTGSGGLGTAHPVPYSPEQPDEKVEEQEEKEYSSLEEALLGE